MVANLTRIPSPESLPAVQAFKKVYQHCFGIRVAPRDVFRQPKDPAAKHLHQIEAIRAPPRFGSPFGQVLKSSERSSS
jgi:hypothetical protein